MNMFVSSCNLKVFAFTVPIHMWSFFILGVVMCDNFDLIIFYIWRSPCQKGKFMLEHHGENCTSKDF